MLIDKIPAGTKKALFAPPEEEVVFDRFGHTTGFMDGPDGVKIDSPFLCVTDQALYFVGEGQLYTVFLTDITVVGDKAKLFVSHGKSTSNIEIIAAGHSFNLKVSAPKARVKGAIDEILAVLLPDEKKPEKKSILGLLSIKKK